ncbi:trichothecene efflux pump [Fusarium pseudocircinatum]|uniref:Trichothecene efflux pump n=1 Tax=Fusarium pseudocircinatum TaxID=56676 RepID=A0A8H5PBE9_9HYPO|nr:trichothecene efflux pump [Fusarium pseudocircinatum]
MADGTAEYVGKNAFGDELDRMPEGYDRSSQFIGTLAAQCLASTCAYLGWVLLSNMVSSPCIHPFTSQTFSTVPALINADIGPSVQIAWVATIWTMGSSIGFLIVGRLSDLYGRKWMVMNTTLLGLRLCYWWNRKESAGQLSFGIVLGELVSNKHRGLIIGFVFLTSIPFGVFGPVVARTIIENIYEGWRWSYYLGIILSITTLALYRFLYHRPTFSQLHVGKTRTQQTKELDWIAHPTPQIPSKLAGRAASLVVELFGQAMSGLAIAYIPRLRIQWIAALVMTFITSTCSISPGRWVSTIVFGLNACTAVGNIENVALTCVTLLREPQDIGIASGILGSIRALGGAISQAMCVSILSNELARKIPKYVIPATTRSGPSTKSLPSLFDAINKGDYSDVPGINKVIIDSGKSFRKSPTGINEVEVQAMNECHPDEARVASHV